MPETSGRYRPTYFYVVVLWLLILVSFAAIVIRANINTARRRFDEKAESLYHLINNQLDINETVLAGFAATVDAMGQLDRKKIHAYARQMLKRYPHIFMFEIAQKVPYQDKARFEKQMQDHVYAKFKIREFGYDADRHWHKAKPKPFYLPLIFMEPFPPSSRQVLGLDLNSNGFFLRELRESAIQNRIVATKPFKLVEGMIAYLISRPISDNPAKTNSDGIADRYVMLVILAKSLFNKSLDSMPGYTVILYHHDYSRTDRKGLLYRKLAHAHGWFTRWLLPEFSITLSMQSRTQPFVLYVEKQLGWGTLNWWLLVVLCLAATGTFFVAIRYAESYHQAEIARVDQTKHLFYLANHDSLTGLANRNLLQDRLQHALKQAKRSATKLAVLFLDLDNFKQINDQYGHETGDQLLQQTAERLQGCLRSGDTLARRSGDEFIIILENIVSQSTVMQVVEKIQEEFVEQFEIESTAFQVGISIGYAIYPDEADDETALLKLADQRMYSSKE